MLVRLIAPPNTEFHLDRALATILLAIPNTPIEIPPPVGPRVFNPKSHWTIRENLNSDGAPYTIHATCENCKNVASCTGPTAERTMVFCHCAVRENVPPEIAKQYARLIARASEEAPQRKRAPGSVVMI
jgi:hypothetical protein